MTINRAIQPDIKVPESINIPVAEMVVCKNGIPLHAINIDDNQDVMRVSLVFKAGTRFQDFPFQAFSMVNLLKEGTRNFTSSEISEKMDFYGAYYDASIDRDYCVVTVCTLTKFLGRVLELFTEIITEPTFPGKELKIFADKRKQHLDIEREKLSFNARELLGKLLFGATHPYGVTYPSGEYEKVTTRMLRDFHKESFVAENCFAVMSGKFSVSDIKNVKDFLSHIQSGAPKLFEPLLFNTIPHKEFLEKENAVQSAIMVGKLLFNRNHEDYIGMQVLNTILGGYFGSRLISNIREEKGYTYGIYSTMVNLEATGYMAIATEVGVEFTDATLSEIYKGIELLRNEPIGEFELNTVKNILTGEYLRIIDGPFGIADVTIENIQNGVDNSYINYSLQKIKNTTPEELMRLAKKYLKPGSFTEVVVGKKNI